MLPDVSSDFGARVRTALAQERALWWTTVSADGTPQPNPVWFVWEGEEAGSVVVYNTPTAHRLTHIAQRPQVSLHVGDRTGDEVIVFRGVAEAAPEMPACDAWQPYLDKYAAGMRGISGSEAAFAQVYSVPVRIRLTKVRGF